MNTIQVEQDLEKLVQEVRSGACDLYEFPFRLMTAYQLTDNQVKLMRKKYQPTLTPTDIVVGSKHKALYRAAANGNVQSTVAELLSSIKPTKVEPRFVISTDGGEILAYDRKAGESSSFSDLAELPGNYDFLQPIFGVERYKPAVENVADVNAARHMAKLYDAILEANRCDEWKTTSARHALNLLMTRLLFCMFAQNTGIFPDNLFSKALNDNTAKDGSDTSDVIKEVFRALDIASDEDRKADGIRQALRKFPYVNGGLFREHTLVPAFSRKARRLLLEAADLRWNEIHADIFGSMIQAIVHTDMRADFGMHYTSVPNIMKVLNPLFLSSLREQLTAAGDSVKALEKLTDRISKIRVFDPACGSGNFLIIAYRELRKIETEAFRRIRDVKRMGQLALADYETGVKISNFFGIDPVDFACETAKLSLWISQYQMNKELDEICSAPAPALPLTDAGSIRVGNALRVKWSDICPVEKYHETYAVGNPPYLGRVEQTKEQKEDISIVFSGVAGKTKKLDYVSCWIMKGKQYLETGAASFAFVTTNSICQGEHVPLLWPYILDSDTAISFAYKSFKWANSAQKNAGVACIVVGVKKNDNQPRKLFDENIVRTVPNINAYLIAGKDVIVKSVSNQASGKTEIMRWGNMPADGGNLLLDPDEREALIRDNAEADSYIRPIIGTSELVDGTRRYCLWIENCNQKEAEKIPSLKARIDACRKFREGSKDAGTKKLSARAHQFREMHTPNNGQLVVSMVSSEKRDCIPAKFFGSETIVSNLAFSVHDAPAWLLSIISSRMHLIWAKAIGGQLETRIRYSNTLVYNTFPIARMSCEQKDVLSSLALEVIKEREVLSETGMSLGDMCVYNNMSDKLRDIHFIINDTIEKTYIGRKFASDDEALEHMIKIYTRAGGSDAKLR